MKCALIHDLTTLTDKYGETSPTADFIADHAEEIAAILFENITTLAAPSGFVLVEDDVIPCLEEDWNNLKSENQHLELLLDKYRANIRELEHILTERETVKATPENWQAVENIFNILTAADREL